jgi:hypothetical protein
MISLIAIPGAFAEKRSTHNSGPAAVNNGTHVSITPAQPDETESQDVEGELQVGRTKSLILYVGMESGDYAGYCFTNDSQAGRAILAACKNKGQCKVKATVEAGECEVPGLEATLSASFRILKVQSAKALRRRR